MQHEGHIIDGCPVSTLLLTVLFILSLDESQQISSAMDPLESYTLSANLVDYAMLGESLSSDQLEAALHTSE